jgi:hypothetical protein
MDPAQDQVTPVTGLDVSATAQVAYARRSP